MKITEISKVMNDNGLLVILIGLFVLGLFMKSGFDVESIGVALMIITGWVGVVWGWNAIEKSFKENGR